MRPLSSLITTLCFIVGISFAGVNANGQLSSEQIRSAIARGKQYRTRDQYLESGLRSQRFQLSSAWATDGISKYLVFYTDYDIVAAAAAGASHEMRELSDADVQKLPLSGLVIVNVQLHARGTFPVERLRNKFVGDNLHLVLQTGDQIIQPIARSDMRDTGVLEPSGPLVVNYWQVGNTSIINAERMGFSQDRVEVEFAFRVAPDAASKKAKVILIDGGNKHHEKEIDLAGMLNR
jgi:hypothetical protein